jgi:hypothetical protein
MNLELFCSDYLATYGTDRWDDGEEEFANRLRAEWKSISPEDIHWLVNGLGIIPRKWFVAFLLAVVDPIHEEFYYPMIKAGVDEPNPSLNRRFIAPCIRAFGYRRVNTTLLDILETGTNLEKAGAASALYWANVPKVVSIPEPADPEDVKQAQHLDSIRGEMVDVWERKRGLLLTEFVRNPDLDVRRRIIPQLDLNPASYPAGVLPSVEEAVQIARDHPDDYIRHRFEVQLGTKKLLRPLPPRSDQ